MKDSNNNHDYNIHYRNGITIYAFFCHRDVYHKYTPLLKELSKIWCHHLGIDYSGANRRSWKVR